MKKEWWIIIMKKQKKINDLYEKEKFKINDEL